MLIRGKRLLYGQGQMWCGYAKGTDVGSLVHRWAMAGVAGALGAELLGQGDWYEAPKWVSAALRLPCHQT